MGSGKTVLWLFFILLTVGMTDPGYAGEEILTGQTESPLGKVDFPVSCSKAAKVKFNRSLALLHHMMYKKAENGFAAVAEVDPDCAMAYWGIAMTHFHPLWAEPGEGEFKKGREAVKKAESLKPPTERERAYVAAVKAYYENRKAVDHPARIAAWEKAQEQVYKAYPDDIDAGAFYALAHLATAPKADKQFTHQKKTGELLEKLHKKAPEHPGLFHYTIHAYDNPVFAGRALKAARNYHKLAPDVPHAQHMPSHIFVRLGLWSNTIEWNTRSAAAARRQSKGGVYSLHYVHAMDYLIYAYLQRTQDRLARQALERINNITQFEDSFASAYGIAAAQARYALELRQWDKAARLPVRTHKTFPWDKYPWFESITYFARGLGAARSGDVAAAGKAVEKLGVLHQLSVKAGQNYWAVLVKARQQTVEAWKAFAEGEKNLGLRHMRKAADLEDSVDKHPVTPGEVLPARELLGDMLVLMNKYKEAVTAYEADLNISPNRFNSLYGAGYAANRAGDTNKAAYYYSRLLQMTLGLESDRPELKKIRSYLAGK